jgi:DNA-binding NarL/FixJ family response regulator
MYTMGLSGQGYEVTHVTTISDAARVAAENIPELAVIDIGLPDGSGLDLLSAFGLVPGIPPLVAIIFTNFSDPEMMSTASQRGASAYMVKAETTPARLVSVLKQLAPD